uniref:Serum amyloid A protein n=1 Tax=Bos indicus x Bos taurus TaxID=30522 RepID=A0A4W2DN66_BOBOX
MLEWVAISRAPQSHPIQSNCKGLFLQLHWDQIHRASDLWRAYWDMRDANVQNSGRYFRARGNYEAAQRGPGGVWAAKIISNVGEYLQGFLYQIYLGDSYGLEDQVSNRRAEEWGRSGQDPDHFRPAGLPKKY